MVYHFIRCAEDKGISAYQILDQLKSYNPNAKPTTVYRTLDYLQQAGVIVKIESCSKFVKKNSFPHEGLTLYDLFKLRYNHSAYRQQKYNITLRINHMNMVSILCKERT
ncbi:hypothetical protein SL910_29610 [Klebsiella pneumoniae]